MQDAKTEGLGVRVLGAPRFLACPGAHGLGGPATPYGLASRPATAPKTPPPYPPPATPAKTPSGRM